MDTTTLETLFRPEQITGATIPPCDDEIKTNRRPKKRLEYRRKNEECH